MCPFGVDKPRRRLKVLLTPKRTKAVQKILRLWLKGVQCFTRMVLFAGFLGLVSSEHSAGDKQNRGEITSAAVSGLRNKLMSKRLGDDQTFSFRYLSSARFNI